ncbi:N-acetylneuraminate synthase family protein, partial [Pelagibacteraceae bacterium]|nr:N-acetylneuraminate synthase family protein [Pelagibacteraceae bacterium]
MKRSIIIAEAGVNHNGSFNLAKKLVFAAKKMGADIIKFQIFKADSLALTSTSKANYQKNTKFKNQYEMLKKLELKENDFLKLSKLCKKIKIEFSASFFNESDLKIIPKLSLKRIKIPSGEITNYNLLKKIGSFNKKIILSTGMSNLNEIKQALDVLIKFGARRKDITLLHCNTEYPSPLKDINLRAINVLRKTFKTNVGYSDHTISIETPIAAIALGAKIIEKHFTLNQKLEGPDHESSLTPSEFKKMSFSIRNTEKLIGIEKKFISKSEKKNILKCRQFLLAKKEIKKGEFFGNHNITLKRTGSGGISPMTIPEL